MNQCNHIYTNNSKKFKKGDRCTNNVKCSDDTLCYTHKSQMKRIEQKKNARKEEKVINKHDDNELIKIDDLSSSSELVCITTTKHNDNEYVQLVNTI